MELEYAFAKFQSLTAEEVYVRNLPVRLGIWEFAPPKSLLFNFSPGRKVIEESNENFPTSVGLTKC